MTVQCSNMDQIATENQTLKASLDMKVSESEILQSKVMETIMEIIIIVIMEIILTYCPHFL